MTTEAEIAQLRGIAESTDARLANIQKSVVGIHATLRLMNVTLLESREDLRQTLVETSTSNHAILETLREMLVETRVDNQIMRETLQETRIEAQANSEAILTTLQQVNNSLRQLDGTLRRRLQ